MKSQFYEAYVAGLCPLLLLLERGERAPAGRAGRPPAPMRKEAISTRLPDAPLRRRYILLLVLAMGIGAWQGLPRSDEGRSAETAARAAAVQETFLNASIAEREGAAWR